MGLTRHQALSFAAESKTRRVQRLTNLERSQSTSRRRSFKRLRFSPPPWRPLLYGSERDLKRARLLNEIILDGRNKSLISPSTYPYLNKIINGSRQLRVSQNQDDSSRSPPPIAVGTSQRWKALDATLSEPTAYDRFCADRSNSVEFGFAVDAFSNEGFIDKLLRQPTGVDIVLQNAYVSENAQPSHDSEGLHSDGSDMAKQIPCQWLQCDIFRFDVDVLGKYDVVMIDDAYVNGQSIWDGKMAELQKLDVPELQDEGGLLFIWAVNQRVVQRITAQLPLWGYKQMQELIWMHANLNDLFDAEASGEANTSVRQFCRRTKLHCVIACKANGNNAGNSLFDRLGAELKSDLVIPPPQPAGRCIPDEMYDLSDRLIPNRAKLLLFSTRQNMPVRPNWLSLGEDLDGIRLVDPGLIHRYQQRYPRGQISINL